MDGPTEVSLDSMRVSSVDELLSLTTAEVATRLGSAPFPPSEKLIGALLLKAVDDLREATADVHEATADVARSPRQIDEGTKSLISLSRCTLTIAIVALICLARCRGQLPHLVARLDEVAQLARKVARVMQKPLRRA